MGTAILDQSALIDAAKTLLSKHDNAAAGGNESEITHHIPAFLSAGGLLSADALREMRIDNRIFAEDSGRPDLVIDDLIIEVKQRVGAGPHPDDKHIEQIDRYLQIGQDTGLPRRVGLLTDGKHWVIRLVSDTGTAGPYRAFELDTPEQAGDLIYWLSQATQALPSQQMEADPKQIEAAFGRSERAKLTISELRTLFDTNRFLPTVAVKRDLWEELLGTALGEAVEQTYDLDDMFVRHTYLTALSALAVQASFNIKVTMEDPINLINGSKFSEATRLKGVIESDFFGWITEIVDGEKWIRNLASWAARFDWTNADYDVGRILYQGIISAEERKRLGEYYTPDWLAEEIVAATVDDPLNQTVLDPACGSGTFLRAAVKAFLRAWTDSGKPVREAFVHLRGSVIGVDIHPVAVHLARAAWVRAANEAISTADPNVLSEASIPVHLGDSLQTRTSSGLFRRNGVVSVRPENDATAGLNVEFEFPTSLVERGDDFDSLMLRAAQEIQNDSDPTILLESAGLNHPDDLAIMKQTFETMSRLHQLDANHIWAYFARNLVRPHWLSTAEGQVDRIVGNPPWLTYNKTRFGIREALERLAKTEYGIWPEPRYVTHTDLAALFYTRCLDLYVKYGGKVAMVLPHSALIAGQYAKWRKGDWSTTFADLRATAPWDLEQLDPNDFFPVPACVVFATKEEVSGLRLTGDVEVWEGEPGGEVKRRRSQLPSDNGVFVSPYGERARQGATIVPRRLFFVDAKPSNTALVQGFTDVTAKRSKQEKSPWKELDLIALDRTSTVDSNYVWPVHLGETVAPYLLLEPQEAALPLDKTATVVPWQAQGEGFNPSSLPEGMRNRWEHQSPAWEENKSTKSELSLIGQIDYLSKLSAQIPQERTRLLYSSSGRPTATVLHSQTAMVDYTLFWIDCVSLAEAWYLAAIINSDALRDAVEPLMPKGQYGARHLQKHLWRFPILAYDPKNQTHKAISDFGRWATNKAPKVWEEAASQLEADNRAATTAQARKRLREWLAGSARAQSNENMVKRLLS